MPMTMDAPQERYIPEVTSDQIAAHARARDSATAQAFSSFTRAAQIGASAAEKRESDARILQDKIDLVNNKYNAEAAFHSYQQQTSNWLANEIVNGSTIVRTEDPDSELGYTETRAWENLHERFDGKSKEIYNELLGDMLYDKRAINIFSPRRATLDKSLKEKIFTHQQSEKVELATMRAQESFALTNDVGVMYDMYVAGVNDGLDPAKMYAMYDKGVRRVNYEFVEGQVLDLEIMMGDPDIDITPDDFDDMIVNVKAIVNGVVDKQTGERYKDRNTAKVSGVLEHDIIDYKVPEGARQKLSDLITKIEGRFDKIIEAKQQDRYMDVLQTLTEPEGDPATLLRKKITEPGAREKYGDWYDDLITVLQGYERTGVTDRKISADIGHLVMRQAGLDGTNDAYITRIIVQQFADGNLDLNTYNGHLAALNSKINSRRSREFQAATDMLQIMEIGSVVGGLEELVNSDYGAEQRARLAAAMTTLQGIHVSEPDANLIDAAKVLIMSSVGTEKWMVDDNLKQAEQSSMAIQPKGPLSIDAINVGGSRGALEEEKNRRINSLPEGADSNTVMSWYQESLEKLRRIATIQLMMRAMGQFQTEMGTFEGPSRGLSQWIDVNTPRLDDE